MSFEQLYVVMAEGEDSFAGAHVNGSWVPFVFTKFEQVALISNFVEDLAKTTGKTFHLVKLTNPEIIKTWPRND